MRRLVNRVPLAVWEIATRAGSTVNGVAHLAFQLNPAAAVFQPTRGAMTLT